MTTGLRHAAIAGTGHYVPERVLTNADLSEMLGEDIDEFVAGTLGIRERHVCASDESTADLAERAARAALEDAGVAPEDVDLLIVATDTPEHISPATASVLHGRLGLRTVGAFDLNAACAGFVTALDVAWKYLRADERYERVLVVSPYAMTKYVDYADKKTATIFADGAGAVVVEASREPGILGSELYSDGRYAPRMGVFAGGTREPITEAVVRENYRNRLHFVEKYPSEVNEEGWPRIVRSVLGRAGHEPRDVALWFWTQVNLSTIRAVMEKLGEPVDRAHTIMDRWGYTGAACIPMAMSDASRAGRLGPGDLVVLTGSGAGLAMGAVALRWTRNGGGPGGGAPLAGAEARSAPRAAPAGPEEGARA